MSIPLEAETIALKAYQKPSKVQLSQTRHRVKIVEEFNIVPGQQILELGCGQGDCTAVLAVAVGPTGHVHAVDPGALDYGTPWTLGEAQSHLKSTEMGKQITFHQADPIEFLQLHTKNYDVAILAHCIWYFSSPEVIYYTLSVLAKRAKRILIAEYSLSSSDPTSSAHVHAVFAQASLECRKEESQSNVRTVVSPAKIKEMAARAGLTVVMEKVITPLKELDDGRWEVGVVLGTDFVKEVEEFVQDERERGVVMALRDATQTAVEAVGGKSHVSTMDVWIAVLELKI